MQVHIHCRPSRRLRTRPPQTLRAPDHKGRIRFAGSVVAASLLAVLVGAKAVEAGEALATAAPQEQGQAPVVAPVQLDIYEYRVEGVKILPQIEVEEAVYPFLGPGRTTEDVEKARAALEEAYVSKGYQTVAVEIPPQQVENGVVTLQVTEAKVGRLRVKGSRYFSLEEIKRQAPSLAEGKVPSFDEVSQDIVTLNQWPDRRVTPALRAGVAPGTVDVDLIVEDTLPLHGSVELNNRYSQGTSELRLNASLRYDNLWQLGHSISLGYQVAPERPDDAQVLSGSYLARIPDVTWLSLLFYGVMNDSNVSTLGGTTVTGRGEVIGARAIASLPGRPDFYHSLSAGIDYKHFDELVQLGGDELSSPVTYYPIDATYSANWQGEDSLTQLEAGITFHIRGLGSDPEDFDAKRFKAGGDFIYLHTELARTQELPEGFQAFGRVRGQLASQPLISSEQFSAGGQESVRGYLESEVLGDDGVVGSLELRSPSLPELLDDPEISAAINDWRLYLFAEGGTVRLQEPLPDQEDEFDLASVGVGSRARLFDYLNASVDLALPMISQTDTNAFDPRLHFRLWGEF
jgi:hemolysin activation/secretion protein